MEAFYNLDLNYSYHLLNKVNVHVYIQIPTNLFGHKTAVNFIVSMSNKYVQYWYGPELKDPSEVNQSVL